MEGHGWFGRAQVLLGCCSMSYMLLVPARFCFEYAVNWTYVIDYLIDVCALVALTPTVWALWQSALQAHEERWRRAMCDEKLSDGGLAAVRESAEECSNGGHGSPSWARVLARAENAALPGAHEGGELGRGSLSVSSCWHAACLLPRQLFLVLVRLLGRLKGVLPLSAFLADFSTVAWDLSLAVFVFPWDGCYLLARGFVASYPLVPIARLTRVVLAARVHSFLRKLAINQSSLG